MLKWKEALKAYEEYLVLERALSQNTRDAYLRDIAYVKEYAREVLNCSMPAKMTMEDLEQFIEWLYERLPNERSQARVLSGIRSFFKYLLLEDEIEDDPSQSLEGPKLSRKMPTVLSVEEVESMFSAIDLSKSTGQRDRAILETLYACGLRVSELVDLKISQLFFEIGYIRVIGKNNRQRIIPIGAEAIKYIEHYQRERNTGKIAPGAQDILFLNNRGMGLSRVMIYYIVRDAAKQAGIEKNVSPHTLRHTFATHLIEGGADLKAIQDMLGHKSILTTEIYTHLDTQYLRETLAMYHPSWKN